MAYGSFSHHYGIRYSAGEFHPDSIISNAILFSFLYSITLLEIVKWKRQNLNYFDIKMTFSDVCKKEGNCPVTVALLCDFYFVFFKPSGWPFSACPQSWQ